MTAFDPETFLTHAVRSETYRRDMLRMDSGLARGLSWVFEGGLPDPDTYPIEDLGRIAQEVLRDDQAESLGYGSDFKAICFGHLGLREALAERISEREGKEVDASCIMLTSGTMHALKLANEAFVQPGDATGLEQPTYVESAGREIIAVPLDGDGLRVDVLESELERLRREGKRLSLFYTINDFHSPTGTCLSLERRRRLLELASEYDFLVFQDAVYGEYRFEGEPIPSLISLDEEGRVIRADTFSKIVAPGLRVAWVTASPALLEAMALIRGDLGTSMWMARLLERFVRDGLLDAHLDKVRALYRQKRDIVASALETYCFPWVSFDKPDGGFFIWAKLAEEVDPGQMAMNALAEGVAVRPGERFFDDKAAGKSFFRISYTPVRVEQLAPGIAALGKAISASLRPV